MNTRNRSTPARQLLLGIALAVATVGGVQAQSNSTGNLAGHAAAGETVVVENAQTGFRREITVGESGRFRLSSLPVGTYVVTIKHADGSVETSKPLAVRLGLTTRVNK